MTIFGLDAMDYSKIKCIGSIDSAGARNRFFLTENKLTDINAHLVTMSSNRMTKFTYGSGTMTPTFFKTLQNYYTTGMGCALANSTIESNSITLNASNDLVTQVETIVAAATTAGETVTLVSFPDCTAETFNIQLQTLLAAKGKTVNVLTSGSGWRDTSANPWDIFVVDDWVTDAYFAGSYTMLSAPTEVELQVKDNYAFLTSNEYDTQNMRFVIQTALSVVYVLDAFDLNTSAKYSASTSAQKVALSKILDSLENTMPSSIKLAVKGENNAYINSINGLFTNGLLAYVTALNVNSSPLETFVNPLKYQTLVIQ